MRKFKAVVAGRVSTAGLRPVISPLDDGIMAIPIPSEERPEALEEMREFIQRHKEKEQLSK